MLYIEKTGLGDCSRFLQIGSHIGMAGGDSAGACNFPWIVLLEAHMYKSV